MRFLLTILLSYYLIEPSVSFQSNQLLTLRQRQDNHFLIKHEIHPYFQVSSPIVPSASYRYSRPHLFSDNNKNQQEHKNFFQKFRRYVHVDSKSRFVFKILRRFLFSFVILSIALSRVNYGDLSYAVAGEGSTTSMYDTTPFSSTPSDYSTNFNPKRRLINRSKKIQNLTPLTSDSSKGVGLPESIKPFFIDPQNGRRVYWKNVRNPEKAMSSLLSQSVKTPTFTNILIYKCVGLLKFLLSFSRGLLKQMVSYSIMFLTIGMCAKMSQRTTRFGGYNFDQKTKKNKDSTKTSTTTNSFFSFKSLDFLEAKPNYWDPSFVPINTYTSSNPIQGEVLSNQIISSTRTEETRHITIQHDGKLRFWEGQAVGIIPHSNNSTESNHEEQKSTRLYAIASTRYGDDLKGKTLSLCVSRIVPENTNDMAKAQHVSPNYGQCSNYLCDLEPGSKVKMTGPTGKLMLLPQNEEQNIDYIFVATNSGIAPFRAFLRRLFIENTRVKYAYKGKIMLFFGVNSTTATSISESVDRESIYQEQIFYHDEFRAIQEEYPDQFSYHPILISTGDEDTNMESEMEQHVTKIIDKLEREQPLSMSARKSKGNTDVNVEGERKPKAHIFFSGNKFMMRGIQQMFQRELVKHEFKSKSDSESNKMGFEEWVKKLKMKNQWHVEVY